MKTLPDCTDATMIRKPMEWPCWPFLPVKRRNNNLADKNLGVILAMQEHDDAIKRKPGSKFTVFHVYMFDAPKGKEAWDAAPKTEYDTVEALLQDGWEVD